MVSRAGICGDGASRFWNVFDLLTRESLDFDPRHAVKRFSGICRDGTPWQFCVALGVRSGQAVRFLTEVGSPSAPLTLRTQLTVERVAEVLDIAGVHDQRKTIQMLASLCPADDDHLAGLWVGLAMDRTAAIRVRLYANNGWGDSTERWLRLINVLRRLNAGGFGARLQPLLPLLVPTFSPAGFAVTLSPASPICKLYLRPVASPWPAVRAMAEAVLAPVSRAFIAAIEDGFERSLEAIPDRAAMVSAAGPADGGALDMKLDLCGHCMFEDDHEPARVIERLARSLGLDTSPYAEMTGDLGRFGENLPHEMVAFVGVGSNSLGDNRMNVYLTPPVFDTSP